MSWRSSTHCRKHTRRALFTGPCPLGRRSPMRPRRRDGSSVHAEANDRSRFGRAEQRSGWILVAPYAAFLLLFAGYPIGFALVLVALRWDLVTAPSFAGLENVRTLAVDTRFWQAVGNTFVFLAVTLRCRSRQRWRSPSPSIAGSRCARFGERLSFF